MDGRRFHPIDMPHDDMERFEAFGPEIRAALEKMVAEAYAEGRWRASEDMLWNPRDPEFMAYWAQKCRDPITEPMQGSGLREHFAPFRKTRFDLSPEGFVPGASWTLSAVGDLMPALHVAESAGRLYRDIAGLVFGGDCAFANLECTLASGRPEDIGDFQVGETPVLSASEGEYHALTRHGDRRFDMLQLANNHVLDDGEAGIARTQAALASDGIGGVGVNDSAEDAARARVTRIGDITVGWVAHTFAVNLKPLPEGKPWRVDITPFHVVPDPDLSGLEAQIRAAREAGCEIVLVCLHWGAEWEFWPLPVQLDWARRLADAGADAIIGTHPHVIQPVEILEPSAGGKRRVPVIYSLGNLTATMGASYTTLSLVARLTLSRGRDGHAALTAMELTPVAFMGEEEDGKRYAACAPLAALNRARLDPETRAYVDSLNGYADPVLGEGWRKDGA